RSQHIRFTGAWHLGPGERPIVRLKQSFYCTAEFAFASLTGCASEPVPASLGGNKPTIPRRVSQAAWFSAGSDPRRSRIIFQAATLRAPSGDGPIARATEHWGTETDPLCRRLLPRFYSHGLCEHKYTDGLLSCLEVPITAKTKKMFQRSPPGGQVPQPNTVITPQRAQVDSKVPASLNSRSIAAGK